MILVYTDGSCLNNQSKINSGGWAYYIQYENGVTEYNSGSEVNTTNQRMEMTACIKAIERISKYHQNSNILIYTDSAYICNCMKDKWYLKWYQNKWINSKGEPVKNQDLWERLLDFMGDTYIEFILIKGHSGNRMNDYVDILAKDAAKALLEGD